MKDRCSHIYADLTMCQSTKLYASSIACKRHFEDIEAGSKQCRIQDKRLKQVRKIKRQYEKITPTIKQIKKEVGFSLEIN